MGLGKIKKKINKEKKENPGSKPKIIRTDIKKEFGIINLDKDIEKSMGLKSGGLALKGYGKAYMKGGKVK